MKKNTSKAKKRKMSSFRQVFRLKNPLCFILGVLWLASIVWYTICSIPVIEDMQYDVLAAFIYCILVMTAALLCPAIAMVQGKFGGANRREMECSDKSWGVAVVLSGLLGFLGHGGSSLIMCWAIQRTFGTMSLLEEMADLHCISCSCCCCMFSDKS